jgi:hypothetical protein
MNVDFGGLTIEMKNHLYCQSERKVMNVDFGGLTIEMKNHLSNKEYRKLPK